MCACGSEALCVHVENYLYCPQGLELFENLENISVSISIVPIVSIVSIEVKGELRNEIVNYDAKTKAYMPIRARNVKYQKRAVMVKSEQVSEAVVCRCSSR